MPNHQCHRKYAFMANLLLMIVLAGEFCLAGAMETVEHYGQPVNINADPIECLSCHDDIVAKMGDFQLFRNKAKPNPLGSHPINIAYPSEWSESKNFTSIADINAAGFRLLDGKVVCITCHDLRLRSNNFLPVTTDDSKICFTCHKI